MVFDKKVIKDAEDLYKSIKALCVMYFKENGITQKSFNDVLLAFHIVSHDLFDAFLLQKNKKEVDESYERREFM